MATHHISIKLSALTANYLATLKTFLDNVRLLNIGSTTVTEQAFLAEPGPFQIDDGTELSLDLVKERAQEWLQSALFRDAIEATGAFLDECLFAADLIEMVSQKTATAAQVTSVIADAPKRNHKLHLPQKITKLSEKSGVSSPWSDHVLTLNRVRACIVHRAGLVSNLDADSSGELIMRMRTIVLVSKDESTGLERRLVSGSSVAKGELVEVRLEERTRSFKLGEKIVLRVADIHDCLLTFHSFGSSCAAAVEAAARNRGIAFDGPNQPLTLA